MWRYLDPSAANNNCYWERDTVRKATMVNQNLTLFSDEQEALAKRWETRKPYPLVSTHWWRIKYWKLLNYVRR